MSSDNISNGTLKTIMNFKSDRAQTQQQKRIPLALARAKENKQVNN